MLNLPTFNLIPFNDFESASRMVLAYLHQRLGFELWMMTRTEQTDWIVLQVEDHGYNVEEGTVFRWTDSFCSQMVLGLGPRVAPCAQDIPVYAAAPISQRVKIGAYIGVPMLKEDGSLFGTLCAIDPDPQNESICEELPLVELLAKLLGTILTYDLKTVEQARLLERTRQEALTDTLTGLFNRRGWEQYLDSEDKRARRYGTPISVFIVDLDELKSVNDTFGHAEGDKLIKTAAYALQQGIRESDIVARLGGDEFGILALECDEMGAKTLLENINKTLENHGIKASIGKAIRNPLLGLTEAVHQADKAMYMVKMQRKNQNNLTLSN